MSWSNVHYFRVLSKFVYVQKLCMERGIRLNSLFFVDICGVSPAEKVTFKKLA